MRKRQVDKILPEPKKDLKFKFEGNKKYKVEAIINNAIYDQQINNNQMPDLYFRLVEGLPRRKKYLRAFINSYIPLEVDQHLS